MSDAYHPEPGDIIIAKYGATEHRYEIHGVHIGAINQENLVEIESLSHQPGWTGKWEYHPRMFVPLWMLQNITVLRQRPPSNNTLGTL